MASQFPTGESAKPIGGGLAESSVESRSSSGRKAWLAMGVGLLIAYSLPIAPFLRPVEDLLVSLTSMSDVSALTFGIVAHQIAMVLLILAIIRFWERRPFRSAGLRRVSPADISAALLVWFVSLWIVVAMKHLPPFFSPSLSVHPTLRASDHVIMLLPEWSRISLIVGNSLAEEVGRGYAIERLAETTGSLYAAAFLALLFSLGAHAYSGGFDNILAYLPGQLSLVLLYLWRRNTIACVLSHTLANGFSAIVWFHLPLSVNHMLHRLGF